jgi:hypothetical protein
VPLLSTVSLNGSNISLQTTNLLFLTVPRTSTLKNILCRNCFDYRRYPSSWPAVAIGLTFDVFSSTNPIQAIFFPNFNSDVARFFKSVSSLVARTFGWSDWWRSRTFLPWLILITSIRSVISVIIPWQTTVPAASRTGRELTSCQTNPFLDVNSDRFLKRN